MSNRLALFPGTFDPLTNGHVSIIRRSLKLFDTVVVLVTRNPSKRPLFTSEERMAMVGQCFTDEPRLEVAALDGLLAHYAAERQATALIRGLRGPSDFEYELQMAHMNRHLAEGLETVFLAAEAKGSYVSSSLVREVAQLGGDVSTLVPKPVRDALVNRLPGDTE